MPPLPTSFEELQQQQRAQEREQLRRGFVHFLLTKGSINLLVYAAMWTCILFVHGASYVRSQDRTYWISAVLMLLTMATLSSWLGFRRLQRSVARNPTA